MGEHPKPMDQRSARRRIFSIERHLNRGEDAALAFDLGTGAEAGALGALVGEVRALRAELAEMRQALSEAQAGPDGAMAQAASKVEPDHDTSILREEARILRIEIARMVRSLATAKREIAEIKDPLKDEADDRMSRAACELDEIVSATERATHTILDAGETVTRHCEAILEQVGDLDVIAPRLHDAMDQVSIITEACGFQDITGQRVTKVVKTLEFIEDRIRRIVSDWGREAFLDLPLEDTPGEGGAGAGAGRSTGTGDSAAADDESQLLNGPQLGGGGLSQDDIDALFD